MYSRATRYQLQDLVDGVSQDPRNLAQPIVDMHGSMVGRGGYRYINVPPPQATEGVHLLHRGSTVGEPEFLKLRGCEPRHHIDDDKAAAHHAKVQQHLAEFDARTEESIAHLRAGRVIPVYGQVPVPGEAMFGILDHNKKA